tara:strand:- start:3484 stop:3804 length:321 start_codon:yes stop_codon:yes gene_type:complete
MKTLRGLLTELSVSDGCIGSLEEYLRDCTLVVWEGDEEEHRWRIDYDVVSKIMDGNQPRYFKYSSCKGTNDNSWEDSGYCFEGIDAVLEVFPKEVSTTVYVTKGEL